jgi:hypothetical protein
MAGDITITMEGKTYDLDDFELGDLEWLEEHVGRPLMDDNAMFSMKAMVGFVYLIKRQENPQFTLDEARKIKLRVLGDADEPDSEDEAKPARKRPTKAAASS